MSQSIKKSVILILKYVDPIFPQTVEISFKCMNITFKNHGIMKLQA